MRNDNKYFRKCPSAGTVAMREKTICHSDNYVLKYQDVY